MGRFDWILMVAMALVMVFGTVALGAAAHAGVLETQGEVVAGDEGRCDYYQGDDCDDDDDDDRDDDDRDDDDRDDDDDDRRDDDRRVD